MLSRLQHFQAYFSAPEWQKHHTALIALAQIAEGCSMEIEDGDQSRFQDLAGTKLAIDKDEEAEEEVSQADEEEEVIALGGNIFVPVASKQFQVYFSAPEWQKHHTALIALAQIAEGCSKVMVKNLEQVVNMVLNSFQHPHPRVRWAAINAIDQLSIEKSHTYDV
ncbi:hypothetical protein OROHE_007798 [Orobanche hederae]